MHTKGIRETGFVLTSLIKITWEFCAMGEGVDRKQWGFSCLSGTYSDIINMLNKSCATLM